jgi:hypothetical protein
MNQMKGLVQIPYKYSLIETEKIWIFVIFSHDTWLIFLGSEL